MKQEHEMTPGVLVSGEVLSAGDARARVAVLEAELAELRKRVCVPEGFVVVPVEPTPEMLVAINWPNDQAGYRAMLASAPAPVERVEQDAKVFWVLFDNTGDVKYIKKDVYSGTLAFFDNEADASLAKQITPDTDYMRVEYYTAPQPALTADPWKASGVEYDPAIHHNPDAKAWADLFVQTFPAQADQHELMLGWFANAMMAMHDHLAQKEKPAAQDVEALVEALKDAIFWMEQMQADINACDRYAGSLADQDLYRQHINEAEAALAAHQSGGAK